VGKASAATYYVRADGTATKLNAVGPTADSTACMSLVTYTASTFLSGDSIYFSDKGGNYTSTLTIVSSGSSGEGNIITYSAAPGESPNIVNASGQNSIYMTDKSYVTISGFSIHSTTITANASGVRIAGTSSYIIISSINVDMSGSAVVNKYIVNSSGTIIQQYY